MIKQPDISIDLQSVNSSELVALCRWVGIKSASRGWSRDLLIEALESFQDFEVDDPIDPYRKMMREFLLRYWERVQMQAPKKTCPECYNCRDLQVMECFNRNRTAIMGRR